MTLREEAIRLVDKYMRGDRDTVAGVVVRRANTTGENLLFEMWRVMENRGIEYHPTIMQLLSDVQAESLRWYERGELIWQKQVSPGA